jgi:hypothetical protein
MFCMYVKMISLRPPPPKNVGQLISNYTDIAKIVLYFFGTNLL